MKKILLVFGVFLFGVFSVKAQTIASCPVTNPWGTVQCIPGEYWFNGACRTADNCSGLKEADFSACGCVCTAASQSATTPSCDVDDPTAAPPYVGTQTRVFSNSSCTYSCKTKSQTFLTKYDGSTGGGIDSSVVFQDGSNLVIGDTKASLGTVGVAPEFQQLKLDVNGALGASYYCDADGNNCMAANLLGSGAGGLGAVCQNGYIKKTVSTSAGTDGIIGNSDDTYEWQCAADETGAGSLPVNCNNGQITSFNGTSWVCDSASGLGGSNGLDGGNGLVGQNGWDGSEFSSDDEYCKDGDVLTWGVGELNDYNGDGQLTNADDTDGNNVLSGSDRGWLCETPSTSSNGLDGLDGLAGADRDSSVCADNQILVWDAVLNTDSDGNIGEWACEDNTGANYWTKTVDDLSYSAGKVGVGTGLDVPSSNLDVRTSFAVSRDASSNFLSVSPTEPSYPSTVALDGYGHFFGKAFMFDSGVVVSRDATGVLNAGVALDVEGKIAGSEFCEETGQICVDLMDFVCPTGEFLKLVQTDLNASGTFTWDHDSKPGTAEVLDPLENVWQCVATSASNLADLEDVNTATCADSQVLTWVDNGDNGTPSDTTDDVAEWQCKDATGDSKWVYNDTTNDVTYTQSVADMGAVVIVDTGTDAAYNPELKVQGEVEATEFCNATGECIKVNLESDRDYANDDDKVCSDGDVLAYNETEDEWRCKASSSGSGVGLFMGVTKTGNTIDSYDGIGVGGYDGANNKCSAKYANSRICTMDDIAYTIASASGKTSGSEYDAKTELVNTTGQIWLNAGPPGYFAAVNDCKGWTGNSVGAYAAYGAVWAADYNTSAIQKCTESLPIACCQQ